MLALIAITSLFPLFASAAFFNYEDPLMSQQMPAAVSDIISHPDLISAALSQNIKVAPANAKKSRIPFQPAPSSPLTTARLDNAGSSFNAFTMKHEPKQQHAFHGPAPFNYDNSLIAEKIPAMVSDVLSHPDLLLAPAAQDGAKTLPAHREESQSIQRDSALSLTFGGGP